MYIYIIFRNMSVFARFNFQARETSRTAHAVVREVSASAPAAAQGDAVRADMGQAATVSKGTGSFEERIVPVRSQQAALTISAVYRAVELRSKTFGQFCMQYQRHSGEGNCFVQALHGSHGRLNYLLQVRPNPMMTASAFFQGLLVSRLQNGNGIAYIERDRSLEVKALWLCTGAGYNEATGQYMLQYYTRMGLQSLMNVDPDDVIHIPNTFKYDNGWGIPTLKFAVDSLSLIKTEQRQALETAAKGGRVKLIIGEEKPAGGSGTLAWGLLNKEQIDRYAREVSEKIYQQDVIGIRGLDKVHNISMSAQEQQMIETVGMGYDDVARFWAVPRPLLMMDSNSHYTTYQNANMELLLHTVQPDVIEAEQEFNGKLLLPEEFGRRRFHMCEQPVLRLDKEAQAKVDQLQLQTGAATVNEIRAQYDRPAVESGDIVYVSTNLARLGSEKLEKGSGTATATEGQAQATEGKEGK